MKVIYTALFGDYEELKEPLITTPGWQYICFTDQPLKSDVWEIRQVECTLTPQREARRIKILAWMEWEQSIWIDASFVISKNLHDWWSEKMKADFSCAKHPLRNCVYHESRSCIVNNRGDVQEIQEQIKRYGELKIPYNNGIITSGILLRQRTPETIKLCNEWWSELSVSSARDQMAFAKVSIGYICIHTYKWDYSQSKEFIYKKHFKYRH